MESNGGVIKRITEAEPVAVRSVIIAIFGVVGMVLNHSFDTGTVQSVVDFVLAAFSLLHIVFTRPKVTPNAKVITSTDGKTIYDVTSTSEGQ